MASTGYGYTGTFGVFPETRGILSCRNRVLTRKKGGNPETIGAISSFGMSSSRTIEHYRGVGFGDQIAELLPANSDPVELSVTKTALYLENLFQAFGYKGGTDGFVRALKHHRFPFDVQQEILLPTSTISKVTGTNVVSNPNFTGYNVAGLDESTRSASITQVIITLYYGCWFSSYNTTYSTDTAIVGEDGTIMVTDVLGNSKPATSEQLDYFNESNLSAVLQ